MKKKKSKLEHRLQFMGLNPKTKIETDLRSGQEYQHP